MRFLSVDNTVVNLDKVPDNAADLHYGIYDAEEKDYFWPSLAIGMESFSAPSVVLQIGKHQIQMPLDWGVLIADESWDEAEMIPVVNLNNRGFTAICYNPLKISVPNLFSIQIINVFNDVKCFFPRLKSGNLLAVPLEDKECPDCAFFAKDISKIKSIKISDLLA